MLSRFEEVIFMDNPVSVVRERIFSYYISRSLDCAKISTKGLKYLAKGSIGKSGREIKDGVLNAIKEQIKLAKKGTKFVKQILPNGDTLYYVHNKLNESFGKGKYRKLFPTK